MSDIKEATTHTVPEFFQDDSEEAQRLRVEWQECHLGLDDVFFADVLRIDPRLFSAWRQESAALDEESLSTLRDWWDTLIHMYGMENSDPHRMRKLIEATPDPGVKVPPSKYTPPWPGSIKEHLQTGGRNAIDDVYRWLTLFWFGDP